MATGGTTETATGESEAVFSGRGLLHSPAIVDTTTGASGGEDQRRLDRIANIIRTLEAWRVALEPDPDELAWAIEEADTIVQELTPLSESDPRKEWVRYLPNLRKALFIAKRFLSRLETKLSQTTSSSPNQSQCQIGQNQNTTVLQTAEYRVAARLPLFDGTGSFRFFWGLFESATKKWSDAQKLRELFSLLRGSAADSVAGFEATDDNFEDIVAVLKRRFDQPEKRKETLLQRLHSLPGILQSTTIVGKRKLVDQLIATARELRTLGQPVDTTIFPVLLPKLPDEWRLRWFRQTNGKESSFDDLVAFISEEIDLLEKMHNTKHQHKVAVTSGPGAGQRNTGSPRNTGYSFNTLPAATNEGILKDTPPLSRICVACGRGQHLLRSCQTYLNATRQDKLNIIHRAGLCSNCLGPHLKSRCRSKYTCFLCNGNHHSTLCSRPQPRENSQRQQTDGHSESTTGASVSGISVRAGTSGGNSSGGGASGGNGSGGGSSGNSTGGGNSGYYVGGGFSGGRGRKNDSGNGPYQPPAMINACDVQFSGQTSNIYPMSAVCNAVARNGNLARVRVFFDTGSDASFIRRDIAENLQLPIVDAGIFRCIGFGGISEPPKQRPKVVCQLNSLLGSPGLSVQFWVMEELCAPLKPRRRPVFPAMEGLFLADDLEAGQVDIIIGSDLMYLFLGSCHIQLSPTLRLIETKLGWVLHGKGDGIDNLCLEGTTHLSSVSLCCTQLQDAWELEGIGFQSVSEESAVVPQPRWDAEKGRIVVPMLWKSDDRPVPNLQASKRRVDRMLTRLSTDTREKYDTFMEEKMKEGIIRRSPKGWLARRHQFFLPHRAGEKKFQIYFDASALDGSGRSLNSYLHAGPNLLPKLLEVYLRFRIHKVGFQADVHSAFHQISVPETDQPFLQFTYEEEVLHFTRAVFGVICSPSMFHAAVEFLLNSGPPSDAIEACRNGLYFDDVAGGFPTQEAARKGVQEAIDHFKTAGMTLHKTRFSGDEGLGPRKLLGMMWDTATDTLAHILPSVTESKTMRETLSITSKVWDPLGFLAPWSVTGKLIVQRCFCLHLKWDEPLPEDIKTAVKTWIASTTDLSTITVPRQCVSNAVAMRCYVDASSSACCACIYLVSQKGETRLFVAKTRLAPVKQKLSIPRLELVAAVLGVRLYTFVNNSLAHLMTEKLPVTFYSDSQDVLYWLQQRRPTKLFVANRVNEILKTTLVNSWFYIRSESNPADLGTRGINCKALVDSTLWWEGPKTTETHIPFCEVAPPPSALYEEKNIKPVAEANVYSNTTTVIRDTSELLFDVTRFFWTKAVHITAYCLRFIARLKNRLGRPSRVRQKNTPVPSLTVEEVEQAKEFWLKIAQFDCLPMADVEKGRIPKRYQTLRPVLLDGLLKIQPRSMEPPVVLLPAKHAVTESIVSQAHRVCYHQGVGATASLLSGDFHVSRNEVKRIVGACQKCRRYRAKPFAPPEAPLIAWRRNLSRCFSVSGLDFFGPIYPNGEKKKAYVLIFTCYQSRAIHLEFVQSQTTEDTALALRRFLALRGRPAQIVSDNARTFVTLARYLSGTVKWVFIADRSAWWGGVWERMVGITKRALLTTVHNLRLSNENLSTVLYELALYINLRPLTADTTGFDVITPAHFLYGTPSVKDILTPPMPTSETPVAKAWNIQKRVLAHLQRRWRNSYFVLLRTWRTRKPVAARRLPVVGEMILLTEPLVPRKRWHFGRIEKLITGTDGIARAAYVRTFDAEGNSILLRRALQLLVPMEAESPISSSIVAPINDSSSSADRQTSVENAEVETEIVPAASQNPTVTRRGRVVRNPVRYGI